MSRFLLLLCFVYACLLAKADGLDSVRVALEKGGAVHEKVYVQMDNTCYFLGDTIWYKAYVVRADNLVPTDMSRIAYIELLNPDGLVVERQRIVIGKEGAGCGQFALRDSLFSGYYEIRAYTRWMLNFNVSHRPFIKADRFLFQTDKMAEDFYRDWEGLYSRVFPVYEQPDSVGNFYAKSMYDRPKQDLLPELKDMLNVAFYPEGGTMVRGVPCRVAFEVTDQDGLALNLTGRLSDGSKIETHYMGRGSFVCIPTDKRMKATFVWKGKTYEVLLPEAEKAGVVIRCEGMKAHYEVLGMDCPLALAVRCRGRLCHFEKLTEKKGAVVLPTEKMPSGVNEVAIYDADGRTLAIRQVFVNHHDNFMRLMVKTDKQDYQAYEPIEVSCRIEKLNVGQGNSANSDSGFLSAHNASRIASSTLSLSIRDHAVDDSTYSDGSMLTDLLLCSDLKGFVAHPSYYFEKDDKMHREALDLLLLVQGWRRYGNEESIRYQPEKTLTYEGQVYRMPYSFYLVKPYEYSFIRDLPDISRDSLHKTEPMKEWNSLFSRTVLTVGGNLSDGPGYYVFPESGTDRKEKDRSYISDEESWARKLVNPVLVEAEVTDFQGKSAASIQLTDEQGRFVFEMPPFYGYATLFVKAYERKDSTRRAMMTMNDRKEIMESEDADFYVKQDVFFPVFPKTYNYYQRHRPILEEEEKEWEDSLEQIDSFSISGNNQLKTVKVEKRKRHYRRKLDYRKPAYVMDAYDLFNQLTDRGLGFSYYRFENLITMGTYSIYANLLKNMGYSVRVINSENLTDKDYAPSVNVLKVNRLPLKRIRNVCFYTDYVPREPRSILLIPRNREDNNNVKPAVTCVAEAYEGNGRRFTYKDRYYLFPGFARPLKFYSPDYSKKKPTKPPDYRRTLYWNPNVKLDEKGQFKTTVYNASREVRMAVTAEGLCEDGTIIVNRW